MLAVITPAMVLVACSKPQPDPELLLYRTLKHDGLQREYFVHVPANANSESPLVLVLHGFTSTATGFATMHDLNRFADDQGYIAVYPQGSHFTADDDGFIYLSVAEATSRWAEKLSCTAVPVPWKSEYAKAAGLECTSYGGCAIPGQEVVSCENPGAWHQWTEQLYEGWDARCANAQQLEMMPGQMACPPLPEDRSTRGMDIIWEFLSKYERG